MFIRIVIPRHLSTTAIAVLIAGLSACSAMTAQPTITPLPTENPAPTDVATTPPPALTSTPDVTATPESRAITAEQANELKEIRVVNINSACTGAAFSPVEDEVATLSNDRIVRIWSLETGEMLRQLGQHENWGLGLAYSPDGSLLASSGGGTEVFLWDTANGRKSADARGHALVTYDLAWSRDGKKFATGGQESSRLDVFNSSGSLEQSISTGYGWLWSVAFSDNLLAASNDSTDMIHVYDAETYVSVTNLNFGEAGALDFSPDGSLLVGCHRDGTINVWDTSDWSLVKSWMAHPRRGNEQGCKSGAFSLEGDVYFSGGDDGYFYAWDVRSGERLYSHDYKSLVWSISLSGDGEKLALGLDNGTLHIFGLP